MVLDQQFDEVYQLAADMGGMGFIHSAECEIMRNSALININMIDAGAATGIRRYFFSSSVFFFLPFSLSSLSFWALTWGSSVVLMDTAGR